MAQVIFSISGLRGIYPESLTPALVSEYTRAFARTLDPGPVLIGRDTRASSTQLQRLVQEALTEVGFSVVDLGIVPTPTLVLAVRDKKARGGIMITASHNPAEWNGLKFVSREGRFLNPAEVEKLKLALAEPAPASARVRGGVRRDHEAIERHISAITEHALLVKKRGRRLRVGIDACGGATCEAGPRLLAALGCEVVPLNCEIGASFPRGPEPAKENLGALAALVQERRLDLGLAFDPDGDRLGAVDERGNPIGEEATLALACQFVLSRQKGDVVINLSTTRAVEDVVTKLGGEVFRTPVGEAAVVEKALAIGAVLAGEGNGGVILPSLNRTRDGLVAAALLLAFLADTGRPLSALVAGLPVYHQMKVKSSLNPERWTAARVVLEEEFGGAMFDHTDGLRITQDSFWLHIRPSNTEPIIRIIAESKDPGQTTELIRRAEARLASLASRTV